MPLPQPTSGQDEQEYISSCIREIIGEYDAEGQAYAVCKAEYDKMSATEDITDNIDDAETEVEQGFNYATKESEEFATLPTTDCMEKHQSSGYTEKYAKDACSSRKPNDGQQGGVVGMSAEFGRTKFEYPSKPKESLNEYMGRCMGDAMVREKKKDRGVRAGFCYTQYQQRYIANIAMGWK
jgi:hypothetical protein